MVELQHVHEPNLTSASRLNIRKEKNCEKQRWKHQQGLEMRESWIENGEV